jgi:endonuclease-8
MAGPSLGDPTMEGPSLYLASEQLQPFVGERIRSISGNSKIDQHRFGKKIVKDVFSWGKHLVFQFDDFALRIHFLLFGTFEAVVDDRPVTGDYRRARVPRLKFIFQNGEVSLFNCSLKFIESARAKKTYDFSIDILSSKWDPGQALEHLRRRSDEEIADVLLDQEVFAGVGNIIKNEVLSLARTHPESRVRELSAPKRKEIISLARSFSEQFPGLEARFRAAQEPEGPWPQHLPSLWCKADPEEDRQAPALELLLRAMPTQEATGQASIRNSSSAFAVAASRPYCRK